MSSNEFQKQLEQIAPAIHEALHRWALPDEHAVPNVNDGVRYALGLEATRAAQRGKRLRPALAVLTCEALGGDRERVMPFAVAVELMHNSFLVHDDIEDGDDMRHGLPSVWRRFGLAHGVNIGDCLNARVTAVLLKSLDCGCDEATVLRLIALIADTLHHTIRGQALDINARTRADLTVDDYLEIVTEKTGFYLAAPMVGGAIMAGADDALLDAIRDYGAAVGPMYQIVDDLIDLTDNKGRDERGADIREGKRSFMVAHSLSRLGGEDRAELLRILDRPRQSTSTEDVARAIALFESCGATDEARTAIRKLAGRAREVAVRMPERLAGLLASLTAFLENRTR
jgi:geranylgeranyl pyrophosphate synthase